MKNCNSNMPVSADTYDETFFNNWIDTLKRSLLKRLPQADQGFAAACDAVDLCQRALSAAQAVVSDIAKQQPVDEALLERAKALVDKETNAVNDATNLCQDIAQTVLKQNTMEILLSDAYDDSDLITLTVLKQSGAKKLANWCATGDEEASELMGFLHDPAQIKLFLRGGGARNGEYGRAVQIFRRLVSKEPQPDQVKDVTTRLALAVALELCSPLALFRSNTQFVDPIQRYMHYEQAYRFGELDPMFDTFQVWELRGVVNSDASNEELGWGRESLLNFRPDIAYSDDPKWRYCEIVRTDVTYKAPEWYKKQRSYDQILSGGGKCGPRAWYGRFICKAFGIPTWGVKQIGHAAMSRWTTQGWTTCLGGDFKWTYWEGRSGLDYQLETQARYALNNDETAYLNKVVRLELIGLLNDEDTRSIRMELIPAASTYWTSLALFQRRIISSKTPLPVIECAAVQGTRNIIQTLIDTPIAHDMAQYNVDKDSGTVIIPAAPPCDPPKETKTMKFLKSTLGGKQLLLIGSQSISYDLPLDMLSYSEKYWLQLRVCTVHRHEEPFLVTIKFSMEDGKEREDQQVSIDIPYTMGLWEETEEVLIELGGSEMSSLKLEITRQSPQGLSIKDIKLTPFEK